MDEQHALHRVFIEELSELERFRTSYLNEAPGVPLRSDDPDIMRLLEALALFSARTRLASERSVQRSLTRLFVQQFPYLLTPMPAMAMVQAVPTNQLADTVVLPASEALEMSTPTGPSTLPSQPNLGGVRMQLRTTRSMRVLPLRLQRCVRMPDANKHRLVLLRFESTAERTDEVDEVDLYIDHGELKASLAVFHELKRHLREVQVAYDADVSDRLQDGQSCAFSFGTPPMASEATLRTHPLDRVRAFFHFPEQELFLRVRVPRRHGRAYSAVVLQLDLGRQFPSDLLLTTRSFATNVTPVINLKPALSTPVEYDATQERLPVRPADLDQRLRPLEVRSVYQIDEARGLLPLAVSHLVEGDESYDVDYEGDGSTRRAYVRVTSTRRFFDPMRLVADVVWYQPTLAYEAHLATVSCADRAIPGLSLLARGDVRVAAESTVSARDALVSVLALRTHSLIQNAKELKVLLECVGAADSALFAPLVTAIQSCTAQPRPSRTGAQGLRYEYEVVCTGVDRTRLSALDVFGDKLLTLLSSWSAEEVVGLSLSLPELDLTLSYGCGTRLLGTWHGSQEES